MQADQHRVVLAELRGEPAGSVHGRNRAEHVAQFGMIAD